MEHHAPDFAELPRHSPVYPLLIGDLAVNATFHNTYVQLYLTPPWEQLNHIGVIGPDGRTELRVFNDKPATAALVDREYPYNLSRWPIDAVIADWQRQQVELDTPEDE